MRWPDYGLIITYSALVALLVRGMWRTRRKHKATPALWALGLLVVLFWPLVMIGQMLWQSRNLVSDQLDPYIGALWNENGEADPKEVDIWIKEG